MAVPLQAQYQRNDIASGNEPFAATSVHNITLKPKRPISLSAFYNLGFCSPKLSPTQYTGPTTSASAFPPSASPPTLSSPPSPPSRAIPAPIDTTRIHPILRATDKAAGTMFYEDAGVFVDEALGLCLG